MIIPSHFKVNVIICIYKRCELPNEIINIELELLKRIAAGDQKSFQYLFNAYWDRIHANALHFLKSPELARDLAQEVFIRIWISRKKLARVLHFEAYLYRVAKNIFLDHLRKNLVIATETLQSLELQAEGANAQDNMELGELQAELRRAISYLPVQMQTAFKLSRFNGLTHEEIARKMKISKVTSQNYIARSLALIRKHLQHHMGHYLVMLFLTGNFFKKF